MFWVAQVASGHWPVPIIKEGEHGMLRRGTLDVEGGYEHSAQTHRGVAQSDNVHSKPMNCHRRLSRAQNSDLRRWIPSSRRL